jgi:hypothetical protein
MLVATDFLSDELQYIPCIHTPTGMFNIKVITIFGFLYITCNSSVVPILRPFWSFIGPYIFLNTFHPHVLRDEIICSVTAHVSQPYSTTGLIAVVYTFFSFVCFIYILSSQFFRQLGRFESPLLYLLGQLFYCYYYKWPVDPYCYYYKWPVDPNI